jgi:hypothetical protein
VLHRAGPDSGVESGGKKAEQKAAALVLIMTTIP